ncbi:MAG TPA: hypothetical protein VJG32_09735 [Anaerolineae bacterium]|nr:hypothetical protein [Anaerolineae bacterium]
MFEHTSRYTGLATATHTAPDGRVIIYVRRRFLPHGQALQLLAEVTITEGDRLDLIAARALGDAEQFWRVCDANDALHPDELTVEPGRTLRIALPGVEG